MQSNYIKYFSLFGLAVLMTVAFIVSKEVWSYLPGHHDHGHVANSYGFAGEGLEHRPYACENGELDLITCSSDRFWSELKSGGFVYYWILKYAFIIPWQTFLIFASFSLLLLVTDKLYCKCIVKKK